MRGIGRSFNSRLIAVRDFEESQTILSFLDARRLTHQVEKIGHGLLRLKPEAEDAITDSVNNVFLEDVGRTAESNILSAVRAELKTIKQGDLIKTYVSFKNEASNANIRASVHYLLGPSSLSFTVFSDLPPVSDDEIRAVIEEAPSLAWVTDPRSPLYIQDAEDNLRLHLAFKRLLQQSISKEHSRSFRGYARKLLLERIKIEQAFPAELTAAKKKALSMIKLFSNTVEPAIEVIRITTPGEQYLEYQSSIILTGSQPFTLTIGMRTGVNSSADKPIYAIGIREGVYMGRWQNFFEPYYLKDVLEPDPLAIKHALTVFGYRTSAKRIEVLFATLIRELPAGIITNVGGSLSLRLGGTYKISSLKALAAAERTVIASTSSLVQFCTDKKIGLSGEIEFLGSKTGKQIIALPKWTLSTAEAVVARQEAQVDDAFNVSVDVTYTFDQKSNIKYLFFLKAEFHRLMNLGR
jgi:hypothetical protein